MKPRVTTTPTNQGRKIFTVYKANSSSQEVYISSTRDDFEYLVLMAKDRLESGNYDDCEKAMLELQAAGKLECLAWVPEEYVDLIIKEATRLAKRRGEVVIGPSKRVLSTEHKRAITEAAVGEQVVAINLRGETITYPSISETARVYGIGRPALMRAITNKQPVKRVGNLYFCKLTGYLKLRKELEDRGIIE